MNNPKRKREPKRRDSLNPADSAKRAQADPASEAPAQSDRDEGRESPLKTPGGTPIIEKTPE